MPDLEKPVTLGYLIRQGVRDLECRCNACGHAKIVPLSRLMLALSQATPVTRASRRLRCTRCRRKDVTMRLARNGREVRPYR